MSLPLSSAIVPVSADEISRRSYEQKYLIEEKIVLSLVEMINQGIRDQVSHGLLQYDFGVPSLLYGFPMFDVQYVATKLRTLYASKGFHVTAAGQQTTLTWKHRRQADAPPDRPKPTPPPSSKKKIPLLLSS